jgi:hypothetical protein
MRKILVSQFDLSVNILSTNFVGARHLMITLLEVWLSIEHGWTTVGWHLGEHLLLLLKQEDLLLHKKQLLLKLLRGHHHRVLHELLLIGILCERVKIHQILSMKVHFASLKSRTSSFFLITQLILQTGTSVCSSTPSWLL